MQRTARSMLERLEKLEREQEKARLGGGREAVERHHDARPAAAARANRAPARPRLAVPRDRRPLRLRLRVRGRCLAGERDRRRRGGRVHGRRLRPDRPRRHQQPLHAAQAPARPGDRGGEPAAGDRLRRVRRRRPAAPEGDLRPRRRQLPQPDPSLRGRDPERRPRHRQLDRRRRLPARHVRLHGDGPRAGADLPRRPAAGQDGDRGGGRGGGAGRRRDALAGLRRLRVHRRRRARRRPDRSRDHPQPELAQARPRAARRRRRPGPRPRGAARASPPTTCGSRSTPAR